MLAAFKKDHLYQITLLLFAGLTAWWAYIQLVNPEQSELFSDMYWILPAWGGLVGLLVARAYGGFKSILGRSISFFSLGLLFQVFGQLAYTYYAYILAVEAPYPSVGDVGFFGSIPLYIYAVWMLARAAGAKLSLASYRNKLQAVVIPLVILAASYWFFLREYELDPTQPLTTFLDFGYPLGQAIYISLAILTYTLSRKLLGGLFRPKILLILFALVVQYAADFMFLYQVYQETWVPGGLNDYVYLIAYFVMTISILRFKTAAASIKG